MRTWEGAECAATATHCMHGGRLETNAVLPTPCSRSGLSSSQDYSGVVLGGQQVRVGGADAPSHAPPVVLVMCTAASP